MVNLEFLPPRQTVNLQFYLQVLNRLKKKVNCVSTEITVNWNLLQDGARPYMVLIVTEYLMEEQIRMFVHIVPTGQNVTFFLVCSQF